MKEQLALIGSYQNALQLTYVALNSAEGLQVSQKCVRLLLWMEYLSVPILTCSKCHNEKDAGYGQCNLPFWHMCCGCCQMLQHVQATDVSQQCSTYMQGSLDSNDAALYGMPTPYTT